jgi:hypothetical protein
VYTAAPDNRQNASVTNAQSLALSPTGSSGTDIFVNYLVDTTGYTFYLVYTTNGTAPSRTNGAVVNMSLAVISGSNRIWAGKIPQQTPGTVVNYVIYANTTGGTLAAANNRIASSTLGIQASWTEGDNFYTFYAPGGVTGATFWSRSDAGVVTSGANVTSWTNQSNPANSLGMTPTPPTRQSSDNINFNPTLTFGGAAVAFTPSNVLAGNSSYSRIVVFNTSQVGPTNILGSGGVGGTGLATLSLWKPAANDNISQWAGGNFGSTVASAQNIMQIASSIYGDNVTNGTYININGTQGGTTTHNLGAFTASNVALGGAYNIGWQNVFTGRIPEAIVYPSALATTPLRQVESYLAIKYGATMTTDYVASNNGGAALITWSNATNAGFNNNIAGIGRDDNTALLQKQSRSENGGFQPIIGLGTIAATNQANASTGFDTADRSFLIWGDNGAATSITTPSTISGFNYRMARVWRVQETGTVGSVKVAIPASAITGNIGNLSIITASDAAFSTSVNTSAMSLETINATQYYTTTVDFTSGQFFTFGGLLRNPGGVLGVRLWLRADQGTDTTTEGAAVNTVSDQSGNGFNALAPSPAANKPLFRTANSAVGRDFNFNPYFDFTANRGFYNNQAIFTSDNNNGAYFVQAQHNGSVPAFGATLMAVARGTTPGTAAYMDQAKFYFTSNTNLQWLSNFTNATVNDVTAAPALYSANWTGPAATNKILQMSSQGRRRITTGGLTALVWGGGLPSSQFTINDVHASGAGDNSGSFYAPEFIIFNTTLSDLDILRVNSYMSLKYGTTKDLDLNGNSTSNEIVSGSIREGDYVASDGNTVVWTANANTSYNNNIAGIARDDASALNQKVSKSINSGSILTIATNGNFTLPNTDVSRTAITNDLSFLVIGDDNGSSTVRASTNLAPGFITRITRLWRVQNTNYSQAVSLQFSGLDHTNFTWNLVWKSADANFTTGATTLGTLNSSGQITIPAGIGSGFLSLQALGVDRDSDGVLDIDDLDDDNDGILDVNEQKSLNLVSNGAFDSDPFSPATQGWITNSGSNYFQVSPLSLTGGLFSDLNLVDGSPDGVVLISQDNTNPAVGYIFPSGTLKTAVNYDFAFDVKGGASTMSNAVLLVDIWDVTTNSQVKILYNNNIQSFNSNSPGIISNSFTVPDGSHVYAIRWHGLGAGTWDYDYYIDRVVVRNDDTSLDTDGDGILDLLDLDSDNDGCVDAIEGGAGITTSQLVTASGSVTVGTGSTASNQNLGTTVNANGVPQFVTVPSGYSNTTGQAMGTSQVANTVVTGTVSSDQTITVNTAPASLALTGSSGGAGFQWQVSSDNITFSDISGATTATYSPGILTATRYFRVSASSPGGCQFISNTVTITVNSFCYKPAATVGTTLDSKHGITALGRAGAVGDNWPMVRKGAWTVLESKTKGFVINRLTAAQIAAIPPANLVEGMMIYDTTNNCMKIYSSTDGGSTFGWECFDMQTCPD